MADLIARFVGGPLDGETQDVQLADGAPPERLRRAAPPRISLNLSDTSDLSGPVIAEYRVHLDASGHPSRAEDGAYRYVYRGQS